MVAIRRIEIPSLQDCSCCSPQGVCDDLRRVREPREHEATNQEGVVDIQKVQDAGGRHHFSNAIAGKDCSELARRKGVVDRLHCLNLRDRRSVSAECQFYITQVTGACCETCQSSATDCFRFRKLPC